MFQTLYNVKQLILSHFVLDSPTLAVALTLGLGLAPESFGDANLATCAI